MAEFQQLWDEAESIWDQHSADAPFHGYVSADFAEVLRSLVELRSRSFTFVEWGSGLGVVTIMASRLGYDAYGIEAEGDLVDYSRELASVYGPDAQFVEGSFIPDEFDWDPGQGDEEGAQ